jgi:hypothetical protein
MLVRAAVTEVFKRGILLDDAASPQFTSIHLLVSRESADIHTSLGSALSSLRPGPPDGGFAALTVFSE